MGRAYLKQYKGKEIYIVDYKDIDDPDLFLDIIRTTNNFRKELVKQGKKDLLMFVDVSNSFVYGKVLQTLKTSARETKRLVKKGAIIGVSGAKQTLLKFVIKFSGLKLKTFQNSQDALEWLVS